MSKEVSLKSMRREARENPDAPQGLTEEQINNLVKLTTERCSFDTKQQVRQAVSKPFDQWPGRPLMDRLYFDGNSASYCAGQDYIAEMPVLRKELKFS